MFTPTHLMARYIARKSKMPVISKLCCYIYGSAKLAQMSWPTCWISLLIRIWGGWEEKTIKINCAPISTICLSKEKPHYTSLQNNIITGNCNTLNFLHHLLSCTFNTQYPLFILSILLVTSNIILHDSNIKYINSHYSSLLTVLVHTFHFNVLKLKLGSYMPYLKMLYMLPSAHKHIIPNNHVQYTMNFCWQNSPGYRRQKLSPCKAQKCV
jgi:hypothetical protein